MTAVKAIYDGNVFIPERKCNLALSKGSEVTLTIKSIDTGFSEKQKKLVAFRQLTNEINELNKTSPLPPEFEDILSKRVQFREHNVQ